MTGRAGRRLRTLAGLGTACAATGLLVLPAAGAAGATTSPTTSPTTAPTTTPSATPAQVRPERVVDRIVKDPRIDESSGLLVSGRLAGVYWTFNDSGGKAVLYGIGRQGTTVATLEIDGAGSKDWEAATAVRDAGGRPALAVADIGDNDGDRRSVKVYVVREPSAPGTTRSDPVRTITLTYPDQPADAEAVFADPATGRLHVVTKGLLGGRLYAVPEQAWPGRDAPAKQKVSATLEYLAEVPLGMVTDGVALPDGRVALRTYGELAIMPPVATLAGDSTWTPLATTPLPRQGQGEGLGVLPDGDFVLSTEGVGKPVLRFTAPQAVADARPPTPTPTPAPGAGGTTGSAAGGGAGAEDGPSASGVAALGAVGVTAVLAVAASVAVTRRRRA
ncbi:hypothetical protein [Kineosporia sp. A_224]|uniref:hypothetical protein n=1 Tax=Kineosporia sp. A_224 TaxID=1962180 RepID=UPI000B4AE1BE|nr:hypothetical protein [Kineosporia sp. A_224]